MNFSGLATICAKLPHSDRYDYGFLPPRFFNQVLDAFGDWYQTGRRRVTPRE